MRAGFFSIKNSHEVSRIADLAQAKKYLHDVVDEYLLHNKPLESNIVKVRNDIDKATSVKALVFTTANYVLAHPSEGLKVIK